MDRRFVTGAVVRRLCLLALLASGAARAEYDELPKLPPFLPPIAPLAAEHGKAGPLPGKRPARPLKQDKVPEIKFPCALKIPEGRKDMPKLIFVGERHGTAAARDARKELEDKAVGGQCYVGLEGVYCLDPGVPHSRKTKAIAEELAEDNILGYDDPLTHALSGLMGYYLDLTEHISKPAALLDRQKLLEELSDLELLKQAWKFGRGKKMLRGTADEPKDSGDVGEKEIVDLFDRLAAATPKGGKKIISDLLSKEKEHAFLTDDHAMLSVLKAWIRSFGKMVAALPDAEKTAHAVPSNLSEHLEDLVRSRNPSSAYFAITLDWRNQFMAMNLAKAYCKALAAGKDLYAVMGKAHEPGLKDLLETASAAAGQKLVIERKNSDIDSDDAIEKALQKVLESLKKGDGLKEPPFPFPPPPDPSRHGDGDGGGGAGGGGGPGKGESGAFDGPRKPLAPEKMRVEPDWNDAGKPAQRITWVVDGVRYTLYLKDDTSFDKTTVIASKGEMFINSIDSGPLGKDPGRRRYLLRQLEDEIKKNPDGDVAKAVAPLKLPASSSIAQPEKTGPAPSRNLFFAPNPTYKKRSVDDTAGLKRGLDTKRQLELYEQELKKALERSPRDED